MFTTQQLHHQNSPVVENLQQTASRQLTETDPRPKIVLPKWFDQPRFDVAKTVIQTHFMAIFFSHLAGLVLLVFIKSVYTTLALTGKSKNYTTTFYRYMRTVVKVKKWYDGKVYEDGDDAAMALLEVRRMHQQTSHSQNRDRKLGEELAISQRDMVLTQFAFIGLTVLYPTRFGIHKEVNQTVERLIYFWKVIGSLLGIKDEHNLCTGSVEEVKKRCEVIFEECFRPALQGLNPEMFHMCKLIIVGTEQWVWATRFRSTFRFLLESVGVTGSDKDEDVKQVKLWDDFTFMETFAYVTLKYLMTYGLKFDAVRWLLNQLFKLAVWRLGREGFVKSIAAYLNKLDGKLTN